MEITTPELIANKTDNQNVKDPYAMTRKNNVNTHAEYKGGDFIDQAEFDRDLNTPDTPEIYPRTYEDDYLKVRKDENHDLFLTVLNKGKGWDKGYGLFDSHKDGQWNEMVDNAQDSNNEDATTIYTKNDGSQGTTIGLNAEFGISDKLKFASNMSPEIIDKLYQTDDEKNLYVKQKEEFDKKIENQFSDLGERPADLSQEVNDINDEILELTGNGETELTPEQKKEFFVKIASTFAGYPYDFDGNNQGRGFNENFVNSNKELVCTSYVENVLRVADDLGTLQSDKNKSNGVAIAEEFGLTSEGIKNPSDVENLDTNNVYAVTFFKKDFKCGNYQEVEDNPDTAVNEEKKKFENASWFDEDKKDQYIVTEGEGENKTEYGTEHTGFLVYDNDQETKGWKIIHQHSGKNLEKFENHRYNNDDKYRFKVYKIYD